MSMKYILRIIALPFLAIIVSIPLIKTWAILLYNFLRYGGEVISYHNKHQRATIHGIYSKLEEDYEKR